MELSRLVISETNDEQTIVLKETGGERSFPISIGLYEAAAIDRKIKGHRTQRPLTHDLLTSVIAEMGAHLAKVVVHELREGTFYAKLVLDHEGREVEVDSRPSDAIVLAISAGAPIFVEEAVLEEVDAR
ncbi:MAG: bifunctional nuclease family protein [Planctomycetes bacterium]|nr:bifunctional nuclease family protein [Planctomycetota bacterium]